MMSPVKPFNLKTTVSVWVPVLALGAILGAAYGGLYGVHYVQASRLTSQHHAEYQACETNYHTEEAARQKTFKSQLSGGWSIAFSPLPDPCHQPGNMTHGFLGIPTFSGDGYK